MQNVLFEVFIFLAAACVVVPLSSRFKLGSVLGYLGAGVVIGPFVLGLIGDPQQVMQFAEFGVVMMLFVIGLELEPAMLWRLRTSILGFGGLQVVLTTLVLTIVGIVLGFSAGVSFSTSMALSLSSTALVLQMLQEKNLMHSAVGETAFSILLFQDIAVIPILIIMPLLAMPSSKGAVVAATHSMIAHFPVLLQALIVATVIAFVILAGRYLSHHLFRIIAKTKLREIFTALSLALVVGITLLMQLVGMSPALGAFVAGVVLANSEYRRTLETDIEPFKGLLLGLFFISVGMGIDFNLLHNAYLQITIAVVALILVKAFILWLLGRVFGLLPMQNIGCALALSQGGEFAFVLFQFAGGLSLLKTEQLRFLTLVVALSIAVTPLIIAWYYRFIVPKFISALPQRPFDSINEQHPIIIAGFGRFGQVIGRFLTAQGFEITVLEKDPDQIDLLRKFGFKGYFGDAARLDVLRHAGAEQAKLLIIAVDDAETSLAIARLFNEEFPATTVFSRARNRKHAYELKQLGVYYFKRETFDSSLNMAKDIAIWLRINKENANLKAEQFRQHDEQALLDSFEFFNNEDLLLDFAKTSRAELERILQNDSRSGKSRAAQS